MNGPCFPTMRRVALAWIAVYVPSYALAYGFANFLLLCNLSVILVAVGHWTCSPLLLSSQAVGIGLVAAAWTADAAARLATGHHVIGGTSPCGASATTGAAISSSRRSRSSACRSVGSSVPRPTSTNAFVDPIFKRTWGGALTHIAVVAGALVLVAYPLTHLVLVRLCPTPRGPGRAPERA